MSPAPTDKSIAHGLMPHAAATIKVMAPWPNYASRRTCVQSQIGATNSVIRGCALMMAFTAWIEPALARSYLNCLAKKVVIVDNPRGSTSSNVEWASGLMRRRKPSCKLDQGGRCRDDHNRIRPVRNCSRPAGVSRTTRLATHFLARHARASFMLFIRYSNSPSPALKTKGCAQCLEEGRADRPREPSPGSELAPWERVLSE